MAPTCGHCVEAGRKRPFHHRGLYSNHHQASLRHLHYIKLFPHSHHLPWGSSGSAHPTKGGLDASPLEVMCISPLEVMCIKYYRKLKIIWTWYYNCSGCTYLYYSKSSSRQRKSSRQFWMRTTSANQTWISVNSDPYLLVIMSRAPSMNLWMSILASISCAVCKRHILKLCFHSFQKFIFFILE